MPRQRSKPKASPFLGLEDLGKLTRGAVAETERRAVKTLGPVPKSLRKGAPPLHDDDPGLAGKWLVTKQIESKLTPGELKVPKGPVPTFAPLKPGLVPGTRKSTLREEINQRYNLALASEVSAPARHALAVTMDPSERKARLDQHRREIAAIDASRYRPPTDAVGKFDLTAIQRQARAGNPNAQAWLSARMGGRSIGELAVDVGKGIATGPAATQGIGPGLLDTGKILGTKLGEAGGKVVLGGALEAHKALDAIRGVQSGQWQGVSQSQAPTPIEAQLQASGIPLTPGQVKDIGLGFAKLAVATPATIPGLVANPFRAAQQLVDIVRGSGQAALAIPMLMTATHAQRERVINAMWDGVRQELVQQYGPDVTWKQAVRNGYNQPVLTLLDAAAVASPTLRVASVWRYFRAGATIEEAIKLSRDPSRLSEFEHVRATHTPRTVQIRGEHTVEGAPDQVTLSEARHPMGRGIQRGYDVATRGVERVAERAGVSPARVWTTPTRRGLRETRNQLNRETRRLRAQGLVLWENVTKYVGGDQAKAARLFHNLERPHDIPEEVWLNSLLKDTKAMLEGREVIRSKPTSPAEAALQRKLDRFAADMKKAGRNRWLGRVADVDAEQKRLHLSLINTEEDLSQMRDRLRSLEQERGEPNTMAIVKARSRIAEIEQRRAELVDEASALRRQGQSHPEDNALALEHGMLSSKVRRLEALPEYANDLDLGGALEGARQDVRTLENRREALKEQIGDLAVDQTPVGGEGRAELAQTLDALPNITEAQAENFLSLHDSLAREWARRTGRPPEEFYRDPSGWGVFGTRLLQHHADVPVETGARTFFQARGLARPKRFDAETDGQALLDKYTPVKKRGEKRPKIAGLPKTIKTRADFRNLLNDMAGRLEAGIDHAKNWYRDSGREILAATGGDVDRADLVAQLTAIYSPQKPVAPNIALALRVLRDWQDGRGVLYGNKYQRARAREALRGEDWLAKIKPDQLPKVRRFYANLLKHIDPARLPEHGFTGREVTVDGWMGAAHGYGFNTGNSGLTEAQFRHVEDVVQQLADHYGVEAEEAQAAIWTSIKAERDRSTAKLYADPATRDEALRRSGQSFADAIFTPKNTLRLPLESMSPEKAWMHDLTPEQLAAHTAEYGNAALSILHDEGFIARADPGGISFWRNPANGEVENNPAIAIEIAMGDRPVTKMRGGEVIEQTARSLYLTIPPTMRETANGLASALGDAAKQAQAAWARYLNPRGTAGDITAYRPKLGRALSEEEIQRLTDALHEDFHYTPGNDGGIIALNDPDSVLDRAILSQTHLKAGRKERAAAIRSDLSREAKVRQRHVDVALEAALGKETADTLEVVDLAHRGNLLDATEYQAHLSGGRRSDLFQRVRDRLSGAFDEIDRRYQEDPAAAAERTDAFPGAHAVDTVDVRGPPTSGPTDLRFVAQSRKRDILGATQFLASPEGQRIIYFTRQADISTLLHEYIGHGVYEVKRAYPEEFAAGPERMIGKPLEEWETEDHELYARWAERYFAEGRAPTPELVDHFGHLKYWMRSIYGAESNIVPFMPETVRDFFDQVLGAYNDQNVGRVAAMSARVGERAGDVRTTPSAIGQEAEASRTHALWEHTDKELAAMRRRNDTRAFNRSKEGLAQSLRAQAKAIQEDGGWDAVSEDRRQRALETQSKLLDVAAEEETTLADRQNGLRKRYDNLEKALASPNEPGFEGALESLRGLIQIREDVLRSIFGDRYDEVFGNRVDLMADFLVDNKMLPPEFHEFTRGTATYAPHEAMGGETRKLDRPGSALVRRSIGTVDTRLLNLHARNNLLRWQNGDLFADPKVVHEAWLNAQAFAFVKGLRDRLWDLGRPLHVDEPVPENAIVIMNGTPLPWMQKASMKVGTTSDVQHVLDALEGRDPVKIQNSVEEYINNVMQDGGKFRQQLEAYARESGDPEAASLEARTQLNVRVIDKAIVEQLYRQLQGGSGLKGLAGKGIDFANLLARWSMIYTNPAYIPVNLVGNMVFLGATGGPRAIADLVTAARMMWHDRELYLLAGAEVGEVPAEAMISYGRSTTPWVHRARIAEQKALRTYTAIPDKIPRIASWIYEARRMGYKTAAQQKALLKGETAKAVRDREVISERATENMVNFERASDAEKAGIQRFLFIWPWIRGATAWPFYYAREFPVATAVGANFGKAMSDYRKKNMGDVPLNYRDMIPLGSPGKGLMSVINTNQFSPTGVAASSIEGVLGNAQSLIQNHSLEPGTALQDYMQPILSMAQQAWTGRNDFGQQIGLRDAVLNNAMNFVPQLPFILQMAGVTKPSKAYLGHGRWDIAQHKWGRFLPHDVELARLQGYQIRTKQKTTSEKVADKIDALHTSMTKAGIPKANQHIPRSVHHAMLIQQAYEDMKAKLVKQMKDGGEWYPKKPRETEPSLTPEQEAGLVYALYKHYAPGMPIPDPTQINQNPEVLKLYADAFLYGNSKEGVPGILAPLVSWRAEVQKYKNAQKAATGG